MLSKNLVTVADYIHHAAQRFNAADLFFGHGTDNAEDEAFALVFQSLQFPYEKYPEILKKSVTPAQGTRILELIEKRINQRIPLPYLFKEAYFAQLAFYVDERVLIPRSTIAELIENEFSPWIAYHNVKNILELCTGSGCIAIACAKTFPESKIVASDLSEDALTVANINVKKHAVETQVQLMHSDLFQQIPKKLFDIIVTNPPYVDAADLAALPDEYLHEPAIGLAGGNDGLDLVVKILQNAKDYLHPHGILIVEVGNSERALMERFPTVPFTWLEFERSDGGVFLLTAKELHQYAELFR